MASNDVSLMESQMYGSIGSTAIDDKVKETMRTLGSKKNLKPKDARLLSSAVHFPTIAVSTLGGDRDSLINRTNVTASVENLKTRNIITPNIDVSRQVKKENYNTSVNKKELNTRSLNQIKTARPLGEGKGTHSQPR